MGYKFEQLEVWQLALEYTDLIYMIAGQLPRSEEYNLKSQIIRAATSTALNIAEGSLQQRLRVLHRGFQGQSLTRTGRLRPQTNPRQCRAVHDS